MATEFSAMSEKLIQQCETRPFDDLLNDVW